MKKVERHVDDLITYDEWELLRHFAANPLLTDQAYSAMDGLIKKGHWKEIAGILPNIDEGQMEAYMYYFVSKSQWRAIASVVENYSQIYGLSVSYRLKYDTPENVKKTYLLAMDILDRRLYGLARDNQWDVVELMRKDGILWGFHVMDGTRLIKRCHLLGINPVAFFEFLNKFGY